jgi:hypothetical protein
MASCGGLATRLPALLTQPAKPITKRPIARKRTKADGNVCPTEHEKQMNCSYKSARLPFV